MQSLVETLIYLLAVMGIIFTTMTLFEMFTYNKIINKSYRIFNRKSKEPSRIEVVFRVKNMEEEEEKELEKEIKEKDEIKLKEIANTIIIEKDE